MSCVNCFCPPCLDSRSAAEMQLLRHRFAADIRRLSSVASASGFTLGVFVLEGADNAQRKINDLISLVEENYKK